MRIRLIACITGLTVLPAFGQIQIEPPLKPLTSTRQDVLKMATKVGDYGTGERYETAESFVEVRYSERECVGHGWKVEPGAVIQFDVYPKKPIMPDATGLTSDKGYVVTVDDSLTSYYVNKKLGLRIAVRSDGSVSRISHLPTPSDAALRCNGFPEYDPSSETYSPASSYVLEGNWSTWLYGAIGGNLKKLREGDRFTAFVFVYSRNSETAEALRLRTKIEDYAKDRLQVPKNRLNVEFGGVRDRDEVEVFIVPETYPRPMPRPMYPLN